MEIFNVALHIAVSVLGGCWLLDVARRFIVPKPGRVRGILLMIFLGVSLAAVASLTEYENMLISFVFLLLGVCLFCQGSLLARFSVAVLLYSVVTSVSILMRELLTGETVAFIILAVLALGLIIFARGKWYRHLLLALGAVACFLVQRLRPPEPLAMWDMAFLKTIFCLLLREFLRGSLPQSEAEELPPRLWALVDMLAVPPIAAFVAMSVWFYGQFDFTETIVIDTPEWIILGMVIVSSLVMLVAVVVLMRQHGAVREHTLLQARQAYYEQLEQSQQQIRVLRHDMANHLQTLAGLIGAAGSCSPMQPGLIGADASCSPMRPGLIGADASCSPMRPGLVGAAGSCSPMQPGLVGATGSCSPMRPGLSGQAAADYIAQLIGSPALSAGGRFCENEAANTILSVKALQIEKDHVVCEWDVVLPRDLSITDVDICALFANLLDNALEACRKLPANERQIKLSARAEKGLFLLKIENRYDGKIVARNGKILTGKADGVNHGLGLAGVRDIARRYDGEVSVKHDGGWFVCVVRLAA